MSEVFWAQARRIDCEHCGTPYAYVVGGTDHPMRVDELAQADKRGRARCPSCHRYQEWMVASAVGMRAALVVGAALLAIFAGAGASATMSTGQAMLVAIGVAVVGITAAWKIGSARGETTDAAPQARETFGVLDPELRLRLPGGAVRWLEDRGEPRPSGAEARDLGLRNEASSPPPA
jgi:hypothetical protein